MNNPAAIAESIIDQLPDGVSTSDPDMTERVMDLFFLSDGKREPADTDAFGVVLERLAYSADVETRADIANRLAFSSDAPVRLMRRLAFDTITVARPVLQYSDCLSEADLVTLARKLDQDHLIAIAHRRRLTPAVTDILVERGESGVLVTVTMNASADFSDAALRRLSEAAGEDPELRFMLAFRPELNPSLLDRFKSYIAGQLLVPVEDDEAAPEPETAADGEDGDLPAEDSNEPSAQAEEEEDDGPKPVYDPIRDSYASEKNLVKLAKAEMLHESITCMSKLTGLDSAMVEHCLLKAELSALMVLCKAHGFSNTTFTVLLKLRQKQSEEPTSIDLKAMLYRYEAMQSHTAKRIIQYANKKKH